MACYGIMWHGRCIPIYKVKLEWPPDDGPDPLRHIFDDVRILVTLNEGIARLSDRTVRDTLAHAVQTAARSLKLPDGMELGDGLFKAKKAMELAG